MLERNDGTLLPGDDSGALTNTKSETMPKLSGHLENAGTMCHDETQRTGGTP
jgi:hypothetical protein